MLICLSQTSRIYRSYIFYSYIILVSITVLYLDKWVKVRF